MIEYSEETVSQCIEDVKGFIQAHWEEVAVFKDSIKLDPDWDKYYQLEEMGALRCFAARDDGVMVSYLVYFILPHIHYKNDIYAQCDVIYTEPKYRNGIVTKKLIEYSERLLTEDGISCIILRLKNFMNMGAFCERLGYGAVETAYMKKL